MKLKSSFEQYYYKSKSFFCFWIHHTTLTCTVNADITRGVQIADKCVRRDRTVAINRRDTGLLSMYGPVTTHIASISSGRTINACSVCRPNEVLKLQAKGIAFPEESVRKYLSNTTDFWYFYNLSIFQKK
jgi:hypothetical protein